MALTLAAMFEHIKHSRKLYYSAWNDEQRTPGSQAMPHSLNGTSVSCIFEVKWSPMGYWFSAESLTRCCHDTLLSGDDSLIYVLVPSLKL